MSLCTAGDGRYKMVPHVCDTCQRPATRTSYRTREEYERGEVWSAACDDCPVSVWNRESVVERKAPLPSFHGGPLRFENNVGPTRTILYGRRVMVLGGPKEAEEVTE